MKRLAFSPAAEGNLEGIWDYSAKTWGPDQAERYTDEIRDACFAVATVAVEQLYPCSFAPRSY